MIAKKSMSVRKMAFAGFSDKLVWIILAGLIWGCYPLFYTDKIVLIADRIPSTFLMIRYAAALFFFFVFCSALCLIGFFNLKEIVRFYKKYWPNFLLMGLILFAARRFEIRGYMGGDPAYTTFSLIYSIFLVILWDMKACLPTLILGSLFRSERFGKTQNLLVQSLISSFFKPMPTAGEVIVWIGQSILVVNSGFFLLQFMNGMLPSEFGALFVWTDANGVPTAGPVVWCLLSAFCLSLFFDQITFIRDAENPSGPAETFRFAVISQFGIAMFLLVISLIFMLSGDEMKMFPEVFSTELLYNASIWRSLIGISFLGTCVAYIAENAGAALHDNCMRMNGCRGVSGREWLSVFANVDPLVSAFVVLFMGQNISSAGWVAQPVINILVVASLSFLKILNRGNEWKIAAGVEEAPSPILP